VGRLVFYRTFFFAYTKVFIKSSMDMQWLLVRTFRLLNSTHLDKIWYERSALKAFDHILFSSVLISFCVFNF
jgi:hypothetical protein